MDIQWLKVSAPEAAQKNINLEILRGLPCSLPPRELQEAFSTRALRHYSARRRQIEVQVLLESLFASMLIRAFKGTLTASWRNAHMRELLQEMEHQARYLCNSCLPEVKTVDDPRGTRARAMPGPHRRCHAAQLHTSVARPPHPSIESHCKVEFLGLETHPAQRQLHLPIGDN